ncbi:GvpL/GvpF family gas vesicle protein [Halobacteria archaeon AArc-dxtr1]|nr:GvpL/GvpF family gas vesicle protein [Halobacteria archaeon AArc-dxtr1]
MSGGEPGSGGGRGIGTAATAADVDRERDGEAGASVEIDDGRYLYCAVRVDEADPEFEATGVDDCPVSVVAVGDVGIVCHACDGLYDSADPTQVTRWLVRHQSVVDAAAEAFGTPIPFQFDTIVDGGDSGLRNWLEDARDRLRPALESLSGHAEYRITVVETEPEDEETVLERDETLADLNARIEDADEGTAYLLERRYEQRLADRRAARRDAVEADLVERLEPHTREVHALDRSPSVSLDQGDAGESGGDGSALDGETCCRLTLLAPEASEGAIGSVLDDVAANPTLAVRFTGPWPPYTFAPELGNAEEGSDEAPTEGGEA